MSAAWESVHAAVRELASETSIKHRLTIAFSKHLSELDVTDFPPAVRKDFQSLAARMTAVKPLRGETAVAATVRKMSNVEAGDCAQRIVALLKGMNGSAVAEAPRARQIVSMFADA